MFGKPIASESYQRYMICKEFGWDFYTYENQPAWFVEEIMLIIFQERQKEKQDLEKGRKDVSKKPLARI